VLVARSFRGGEFVSGVTPWWRGDQIPSSFPRLEACFGSKSVHCVSRKQGCVFGTYQKSFFVWDFPHFVKAREIYLSICPRERFACHVVSIWRSVSREDWIPTSVFTQRIVRRPFLFSVVGLIWRSYTEFHICFPGLFVSKVRISYFPFSRVLCVL
jgi:hypothetical protein